MGLGVIPSWLNGEPSQFSDAYAKGSQQGIALAEMRDRISARNQQRQMQLEEMQSREQERAAAAAERAKEFDARQGLSREEMASREKIASKSQDALEGYRNAQLDLRDAGLGVQESNLELAKTRAEAQKVSLQAMLDRLDLYKQSEAERERHNAVLENKPMSGKDAVWAQIAASMNAKKGLTNAPAGPMGAMQGASVAAPTSVVHRPQSQDEYDQIPPGESYYDPTGNVRQKKKK